MWFKNLRLYRLTQPINMDAEALSELLEQNSFIPCGSQDLQRVGWVPTLGKNSETFAHEASQAILVTLKKQEKVLPASVVNELLAEKIDEIQEEQARRVYSKEKQQLKDEIMIDLLPRAFTKSRTIKAYIDTKRQWLIVDASSAAASEELLNALRNALGTLSVVPWSTTQVPEDTLTHWLEHGVPAMFELGLEAELISKLGDGSIARVREQDLSSDEIKTMLESGKRVKRLGIIWNEHISCTLDDELAIKRIKFTDMFMESMDMADTDTVAEQMDHEFNLMVATYRDYLDALIEAMGGLS